MAHEQTYLQLIYKNKLHSGRGKWPARPRANKAGRDTPALQRGVMGRRQSSTSLLCRLLMLEKSFPVKIQTETQDSFVRDFQTPRPMTKLSAAQTSLAQCLKVRKAQWLTALCLINDVRRVTRLTKHGSIKRERTLFRLFPFDQML